MGEPQQTTVENDVPEFISDADRFVRLDLCLECTLNEAIDHVDAAISYCRRNGKLRLLADIRETTGFPPPSTVDRYYLIEKWATSSGGIVKMAVIARPELIDPERIGITMAQNRSFNAGIFDNEEQAVTWLAG